MTFFLRQRIRLSCLIMLGVGMAFLLSNPRRFSAAGWHDAKAILPLHAWGVLFIGFGLVGFVATYLPDEYGSRLMPPIMSLSSIPYFLFAYGLLRGALHTPTSTFTGPMLYAGMGLINIMGGLASRSQDLP